MKISPSSTNAPLDDTGLPSLLSFESDSVLPSLELPGAPAEDQSQSQLLQSFDAVLAMFVLPQILPQPIPTPQVVADAISTTKGDLFAFPNVLSDSTLADVAESTTRVVHTPAAVPTTAMTIPMTSETIVRKNFGVAETSTRSASVTPEAGEANPSSRHELALPTVSESETATCDAVLPRSFHDSAVALMSHRVPTKYLDVSKVEVPNIDQAELPDINQNQSEIRPDELSRIDGAELPTCCEASSPVLSLAKTHEFTSNSRQLSDASHETDEDTKPRSRTATIPSQAMVELANSNPTDVVPPSAMPDKLDLQSLTEQLSAALQIHGDDFSAGKPIELRLRLDPPELGMVRVHLRLTEDAVSVRFITGDEAVTRLLESQLPDLRQSLAERGLAFAQCDVMCDGRQQQQSSSFERDNEPPTIAPTRFGPRIGLRPSLANRTINVGTSHMDVLA